MKKRHTYFFLFQGFILAGGLLTGCTHDQDNVTSDVVSPLHISSVLTSGIDTRSTTTLSSGTLGVFRLADTSSDLTALNNYLYTGTSGSWVATSGDVTTTPTTKVCAYSPYKETCNDATQLPLTSWIGLSSDTPSHELLYSLPTVASSASGGVNNTSFTLNRAYTKLQFTLSGNSALTGAGKVTSFSIYNKNLPAGSTVNITSSSVSYGEITNQPTSRMTATMAAPNLLLSSSPVIDVLLPPCTLSDASTTTLDVTITVDGIQRLVKLNLAANNISGALAAGTVYPINIILMPNVVVPQPESNCYIVVPNSIILIPVSRATAGNAANFPAGSSFTTGLLWSGVSATHVTATVAGRYIKVAAGSIEGNSVVYVKSTTSPYNIVWSWHIWVTYYNPGITANTGANTTTYSYNGNIWMDRNLGATTVTPATASTLGLLYQWGRKDPFPNSVTYNSNAEPKLFGQKTSVSRVTEVADPNLVNSIQNPLTFYLGNIPYFDWYTSGSAQNDALWYDGTATKTIYDPCPVGWRVPFFTERFSSCWNGLNSGTWNFGYSWSSIGYYPASGYRSLSADLSRVGSFGEYWSAIVLDLEAYNLDFDSSYQGGLTHNDRANGYSVRCVRN
jgi:hypothetical protein